MVLVTYPLHTVQLGNAIYTRLSLETEFPFSSEKRPAGAIYRWRLSEVRNNCWPWGGGGVGGGVCSWLMCEPSQSTLVGWPGGRLGAPAPPSLST